MIPTIRPLPWYGPDDYRDGDNPAYESAKRDLEIAAWEAHRAKLLAAMPWYKRLFHAIFTPDNKLP